MYQKDFIEKKKLSLQKISCVRQIENKFSLLSLALFGKKIYPQGSRKGEIA